MNKLISACAAIVMLASTTQAAEYTVTVTNLLESELLAPILITNTANDSEIFDGEYVTPEAEHQILTGDPGMLAQRIGSDAMVGHGTDGPPGVLLASGKSVTFTIETEAASVRIIAMVAPTMVPDNYASNVVDLHAKTHSAVHLDRFDIGHDEESRTNMMIGGEIALVEFERN